MGAEHSQAAEVLEGVPHPGPESPPFIRAEASPGCQFPPAQRTPDTPGAKLPSAEPDSDRNDRKHSHIKTHQTCTSKMPNKNKQKLPHLVPTTAQGEEQPEPQLPVALMS